MIETAEEIFAPFRERIDSLPGDGEAAVRIRKLLHFALDGLLANAAVLDKVNNEAERPLAEGNFSSENQMIFLGGVFPALAEFSGSFKKEAEIFLSMNALKDGEPDKILKGMLARHEQAYDQHFNMYAERFLRCFGELQEKDPVMDLTSLKQWIDAHSIDTHSDELNKKAMLAAHDELREKIDTARSIHQDERDNIIAVLGKNKTADTLREVSKTSAVCIGTMCTLAFKAMRWCGGSADNILAQLGEMDSTKEPEVRGMIGYVHRSGIRELFGFAAELAGDIAHYHLQLQKARGEEIELPAASRFSATITVADVNANTMSGPKIGLA